jgi:hypothetical protein
MHRENRSADGRKRQLAKIDNRILIDARRIRKKIFKDENGMIAKGGGVRKKQAGPKSRTLAGPLVMKNWDVCPRGWS